MTNDERMDLTRKWEHGEIGDEEFVQAVWDYAVCCGIEGSRFVSINGDLWKVPGNWKTDAEAWQAAADFIRDRIEEVRQLDEEIELMKDVRETLSGLRRIACCESVTFRLVRLLAEAKKRMK